MWRARSQARAAVEDGQGVPTQYQPRVGRHIHTWRPYCTCARPPRTCCCARSPPSTGTRQGSSRSHAPPPPADPRTETRFLTHFSGQFLGHFSGRLCVWGRRRCLWVAAAGARAWPGARRTGRPRPSYPPRPTARLHQQNKRRRSEWRAYAVLTRVSCHLRHGTDWALAPAGKIPACQVWQGTLTLLPTQAHTHTHTHRVTALSAAAVRRCGV